MRTTLNTVSKVWVPLALLCTGLGCSSEIRDYCSDLVQCERGNEYDEDACIEALEANQDIADVYGCQTEYDNLLTCRSANALCVPASSLASVDGEDLSESDSNDSLFGTTERMVLTTGSACNTYSESWSRCMNAMDADWD